MKYARISLFGFFLVISTSIVKAEQPDDSAYIDGGASKVGLILAHGRGKHPTWKVVEPLRLGVNDALGYHTLSLQMPNDDKYWKNYVDDFPAAYRLFKKSIQFLTKEKYVTKIYIMGHSMGSRMASAFVSEYPEIKIDGLIIAGCRNNGELPLSCYENMENIKIAVLDIWGGDNGKDVDAASEREEFKSAQYTQVEIADANHKFDDADKEFVAAVVKWLKEQE
ncbi:hypothetical protein MNBD_GAMMA23-1782 [hydrothermal vent metagenome]|uniref:Uncharacterized protein n=1 Tax=hydrothermal vent metagenome TaxID=652676 RepID=A0A3B1AA30_9ZZZZ